METFGVSLQQSMSYALGTTLAQVSGFLPQIISALIILLLGSLIARWFRSLVVKGLELLQLSKVMKNTPVEAFLTNAEISSKLENVVGSLVYWLFMLLVFHTTVSLLGLQSLTMVLNGVLSYIPKVFSAVLILFFGVLVAGILESLVKGSIKSIDGKHARVIGKVASYLTLVIFTLASVSELGIAQQFINTLFIGLIAMIAISFGLAFGLGSKDTVGKIVEEWYSDLKKDLKK